MSSLLQWDLLEGMLCEFSAYEFHFGFYNKFSHSQKIAGKGFLKKL